MNFKILEKPRNQILLIFLLAFLPRLILCFFMKPLGVLSDETATISAGAYLAGLDWSDVISHAGYYGGGFSVFLAPLFLLTDNPYVIYIAIGIICALLQGLVSVIAYHLLKQFFSMDKTMYVVVISVVTSYLVTDCSIVIFNEHALVMCAWLIVWILLKLQGIREDKKKRILYTLLLMLVLGYSLTLHTRAISFWLSVAIAIGYVAWTYRKCLVSIPTVLIGGAGFYALSQVFVRFMQNHLWLADGASSIRNTEIGLSGGISGLFNFENWQAWANIIMGQIHTIGVFTGGLFILFFVIFTHLLWKALLRKKEVVERPVDSTVYKVFPIVVFCVAGIAMTILGQSISWLGGSAEAIRTGFDNNLYATKAYGYLRYFGPYCGPFFMVCCVYLWKKKEKVLTYFKPALAALLVCEAYWLICVLPYIAHTTEIGASTYYVPFSFWPYREETRLLTYLPASFVMFISFLLIWFCLKKGKQWISIVFIGLIFVLEYFFIGITWNLDFMKSNTAMYEAGSNLIMELDDKVDVPKSIYVDDDRWWEQDHMSYYGYQFMLNRYQIIPWEEGIETGEEEAITFSSMVYTEDDYQKWRDLGYAYYVVDEDELLLVKGDSLQEDFVKAGIALHQ